MELAVPSFVFTPGRHFRARTASGPLDSWIQANPASGPSASGLYPEAIASRPGDADDQATSEILRGRSVPATTSNPWFSKGGKRFLSPEGRAPSLRELYPTSQPHARRRVEPFNSHTVSISSPSKPDGCEWSIYRGSR